MNGNNNILTIPFDQYQRYSITSKIINYFRKGKTHYKILEIGANEHKNLESFLQNDIIKYLDIQLSEKLLQDSQYIHGDATNMPELETDSFDIVIALDVLEHIPITLRSSFLSELDRVAKDMLILAGPFNEEGVQEAEIRVNNVYKAKFNKNYKWLEEHISNGLPSLKTTINYLEFISSKQVQTFKHGSLLLWEKLISEYLCISDKSALLELREIVNYIYNKSYCSQDFRTKNAYRDFLVLSDNNKFLSKLVQIENQESSKLLSMIECIQDLYLYEYELPNKQIMLTQLWERVNQTESQLEESNKTNAELWERVNQTESQFEESNKTNAELWERVNQTESQLEEINHMSFIEYVKRYFKND